MTFRQTIQDIQQQTALSDEQLAKLLETSLISIVKWKTGAATPSPRQQMKIQSIQAKIEVNDFNPDISLQPVFASTGAQEQTLPLFDDDIALSIEKSPRPPIYDRLSRNHVFTSNTRTTLNNLLEAHTEPAPTAQIPPASGMSAGKNTYTYDAHTYHTKMPPQGIAELIRHYLPENGLILDPFAGSGMTGVATRVLGYDCILNELSPAACFIAHHFTSQIDVHAYNQAVELLETQLQDIRNTLYQTHDRETGDLIEFEYMVWSYCAICPSCEHEFCVWDHCRQYGDSVREHKILSRFPCPNCGQDVKKSRLTRTKAIPVAVAYRNGRRIERHPLDDYDKALFQTIKSGAYIAEGFFPDTALYEGVNLRQPMNHGLDSVDKFYTMRNLVAASHIWKTIHHISDDTLAGFLAFTFTSLYQRITKFSEFRFWGGSGNMPRFNLPFIFKEANVFTTWERKARSIRDHLSTTAQHYTGNSIVTNQSATSLNYLPDRSVDLIFTDPPFGANINYSDMNILWESWLGTYTDTTEEAIVNKYQGKDVQSYQALMQRSFMECHRTLRDKHWMLVAFMNSSQDIWEALRQALITAGFKIERVDIFDKQHSTFKQHVSENTTGANLILHCRKTEIQPVDSSSVNLLHHTSQDSIYQFLDNLPIKDYTITYVHVERDGEIDYSQLYGEWIANALQSDIRTVDFTVFKGFVDQWLADQS